MQAVPLLALLDDLAPRIASGQAGHLQKVVLVWLSQSGDEFHIMDPELLSLARWVQDALVLCTRACASHMDGVQSRPQVLQWWAAAA